MKGCEPRAEVTMVQPASSLTRCNLTAREQDRQSWALAHRQPPIKQEGYKLGPGSCQRVQSVAKGDGAGDKATTQTPDPSRRQG